MYITLTHSMGGLCICVCIQVFDKCTTPEQMREAWRQIMKFGPGVLSMVDRILWSTVEVGRKVGSHSAAVRKVMMQDADRGQGSHKDEITFRNENFSLHTAKLFECDAGRKGVTMSLLAFAKQALMARSGGDDAFGGADEVLLPNVQHSSAGIVRNPEHDAEMNNANMEYAQARRAEKTTYRSARQQRRRNYVGMGHGLPNGKKPSSESDKSTKSKGPKSPAVGGIVVQVATDLPANEKG